MKTVLALAFALILAACGGAEPTVTETRDGDRVSVEQCYEDCGSIGNNGYWVDSQIAVQFVIDPYSGQWRANSIGINGCPCYTFSGGIQDGVMSHTFSGYFGANGPGAPILYVSGLVVGSTFQLTYRDANQNIIKQVYYPQFNGLPVVIKRKLMVDA